MRKTLFVIIIVLSLVIIGLFLLVSYLNPEEKAENSINFISNDENYVYPIREGGALSYWNTMPDEIDDEYDSYSQTPLYEEIENKSGVKLNFEYTPTSYNDLLIMLASGEVADIIEFDWSWYPGGIEKAIKDGHILILNDYLEKYCPYLHSYLRANPEIDKMIKTDDGFYYTFPLIQLDDLFRTYYGPFLRKDWLDRLGLEIPETIDEWHTVLKNFKEEMDAFAPLSFSYGGSMAFCGAFGVLPGYYLEGGDVVYGAVTDEYKEYMATLKNWFDEGLIDPNFSTAKSNQIKKLFQEDQCGATVGYAGGNISSWTNEFRDGKPEFEITATPYPVLKKGDTPEFGQSTYLCSVSLTPVISGKCEDIELACRFLDFGYSPTGHMIYNFGVEGESYTMVDGYPTYTEKILHSGESITKSMSKYIRANTRGPFVQDRRYYEQYLQVPQAYEALQVWRRTNMKEHLIPPITLTTEESIEFSEISAKIDDFVFTMFYKFVYGEESLDSYGDYVEEIYGLGLERALEIKHNALERYYGR